MNQSSVVAASLVVLISNSTGANLRQGGLLNRITLPESVALTDAEIQWRDGGGDGCARPAGDCTNYRIAIRGDGLLTLEDLGWGGRAPKERPRQRTLPVDSVVTLIDDFLTARFFESPDSFANRNTAVRRGERLFFYSKGGVGGGWVDLTLRLGHLSKTVRLENETPTDFVRLKERIWEIGGPNGAWPVQ
jgi:hypothetical protein